MLPIEVVYAGNTSYRIMAIEVPIGTSIQQAILQSTLLSIFPEIDLTQNKVGIFGELKSLDDVVEAGDRVEIYRALNHDPMKMRKQKVLKAKRIKQAQKADRASHG